MSHAPFPPATRRALALTFVVAALACPLLLFFEWGAAPAEDAAILMRYAQHLAQGHGVVWNVGEAPIDGATDFLFMVAMAALAALGATIETATRWLTIGAHIVTVTVVYARVLRSRGGAALAALAAAFVAVGPGLSYAEAYFGTTFFAMWAALSWAAAMELRERYSHGWAAACALFALALGLTRPDGVLLAGFIFAALASQLARRDTLRVFAAFAIAFGTLGVAYFLWRWWYFEHPLPNPYYKKGEFKLWFSGLAVAITNVVRFLLPLLPLYALALGRRASARELAFSLVPVAGFTAIWVLVSDEMNYMGRFQYAVVPIAAMSAPTVALALLDADVRAALSGTRGRAVAALAAAAWMFVAVPLAMHRPRLPGGEDGRATIARGLAAYADRGYTLATTEAGLLPYVSGWRAIDTWGLNDATIAHAGRLDLDYLAAQDPKVVLIHAPHTPVFSDPRLGADLGPEWDAMVRDLTGFCQARGDTLAAAWGPSHNRAFYFYVARDIPEHDAFVAIIREARFPFIGGPGVFIDWAKLSGTAAWALPEAQ